MKQSIIASALLLCLTLTGGCDKNDREEMGDKVEDAMDNAADATEDAIDEAGDAVEDAAEKLDNPK